MILFNVIQNVNVKYKIKCYQSMYVLIVLAINQSLLNIKSKEYYIANMSIIASKAEQRKLKNEI